MPDIYKPSFIQKTVILICGVIAVCSAGLAILYVIADGREEREDDQRELDVNYLNCRRGNEVRQTQIDNESEPSTTVLDLTPLLGGSEPQWFIDFTERLKAISQAAAGAPINPDSRQGRRIARLEAQIRDCETEWAGHTPGIKLPHETEGADL